MKKWNWWKNIPQFVLFPTTEERLPIPFDEQYAQFRDIKVEIGFGNGEFLIKQALASPETLFVGFDISFESCERLIKEAILKNCRNILVIRGDAGFHLRELFPPESVSQVFMNFPDPWPKKRHESKRLIQNKFIHALANILKERGTFELATDQEFYVSAAKEIFMASSLFQIKSFEINPVRPIQTRYEKKWLSLGRNIFQLIAEKKTSSHIRRLCEGGVMPHVKISKDIYPESVLPPLMGKEFRAEDSFFKPLELFQQGHENFLVKVISNDDGFVQNYFIRIAKRGDEWIVKLDEVTQPFRTPSVKFSVFELGRILEKESRK